MARVQRTSKGKTMKPNYFVFCEGETEVAYVEMLRERIIVFLFISYLSVHCLMLHLL